MFPERVNDVSMVGGKCLHPSLAVGPTGTVYALWQDDRGGNFYDIYFSHRPAGGTWLREMKVNNDQGAYQRYTPSIAVNSHGAILVSWVSLKWWTGAVFYALANEPNYIYLPLIGKP